MYILYYCYAEDVRWKYFVSTAVNAANILNHARIRTFDSAHFDSAVLEKHSKVVSH